MKILWKARSSLKIFDTALEGLERRFRLAPWHSLYNPPLFKHACAAVRHVVGEYIQEQKPSRFTDLPCSLAARLTLGLKSDTQARDQAINVLLAGRDTTASCLLWTLYAFF
jgi:cytochrome P450